MALLTLLLLSTVAQLSAGNPHYLRPAPENREAFDIGHDSPAADRADLQPLANRGCTKTVSTTYGYPCSWDGTTTEYTSTTVLFQYIDCHGCDNVQVDEEWYYCPNQPVSATLWAGAPTTSWSTICQPSAAVAQRAEVDALTTTTSGNPFPTPTIEPGPRRVRNPGDGFEPAACPTTLVIQPERSAGKTLTTYASFTTSTVAVDCAGCDLVVSTALAGYGPPGAFETTATFPVGTVTSYACS
ncbi:hypothetical protein C7999DRAFT_17618 [Corynascus novoguineensis]|uniref:Uncharacterized protein n=1 Tax=Corynascus novoguineensis TaxID=1126955 RepID=A0AAN7CL63_9PEZI|nr:hypothetical protein C7999DRAFT_17618 [Corynascus novoguineensis]